MGMERASASELAGGEHSGGAGADKAAFTAETFQNEYLPAGSAMVDAVVTVRAAGEADEDAGAITDPAQRAEVIMIDTSGSMYGGGRIQQAKAAAAAAIDCLEDGVAFAVVAGNDQARMVWPARLCVLAVASPSERQHARAAVRRLRAQGGTVIGEWLDLARALLTSTTAGSRHAILLTDGKNRQHREDLVAALESCRGVFQCDCRGIGVDWEVDELRHIAATLLGTVDIVADPAGLVDDFRAMITASQSRALPDVKLRLWAPQGAVVESLRQVAPEVLDMTSAGEPSGPLTRDFPLGGWAPGEVRDYHVRIQVRPAEVGDEMLAGRVSLVLADGAVTAQTLIRVVWTDDVELSTRVHGRVAHYTGQIELAEAIQSGLAAARAGDDATAVLDLGRAAQLAHRSGHHDMLRLLADVVDIRDADSGMVVLRGGVGKAEEMTLDARSVRTVRADPSDLDENGST